MSATDGGLPDSVVELERELGYTYADRALLETALTHSSYANECGVGDNERLEFLGDGVIGMVTSHLLYEAHPDWPEGDLTRALHQLVDKRGLAALARQLDVGRHLRLGQTERTGGGSDKATILADALEALVGAMYVDGGLPPVEAFARARFADALAADAPRAPVDPKTRFQEWVMARYGTFPSYDVVDDSGVEGDEDRFTLEVLVEGRPWARGVGRSKRQAERRAADAAYARRGALAEGACDAVAPEPADG